MKIAISACAADAGKSGIGQYIHQVLSRLEGLAAADTHYVVFTEADNLAALALNSAHVEVRLLSRFWSRTVPNLFWHLCLLPVMLLLGNYQQVIYLAANRRLGLTPLVPSLGVVHDLSQLHIEGKYDRFRTFYVLQLLTRLMGQLSHCVCVSNATAEDVIGYAGVDPTRVETIHNGADVARFKTVGVPSAQPPEPYILYTARLEHPGKNHIGLLRAFAKMQKDCKLPHKLVFAGSPWTGAEQIYAEIDRLGLNDSIILSGYVDHDALPGLVQHADLFVLPSLFEGFGIPLVEAMAAGTPVCASRVASIPEVIGDAGLMFDPLDPEDMAQVMQDILQDPELAMALRQRGRQQATRFSWDTCSAALVQASQRLNGAARQRSIQAGTG